MNYTYNLRPWPLVIQKMCQFTSCLLLAASAAFLSFTVQAQTFQAVPLDGGGHTSGFVQADNGRIYAYGDVFGAWRTDNGGINWNYLNWSIPDGDIVGMGMAVQKNNADVVYYSTYNSLYKSTNGGTSWTKLFGDIDWGREPDDLRRYRGSSQILIRSNNSNEIWFAGPRSGLTGWLWKSSNGGLNWVKAGGNTFNTNKAITLHNISAYANQIWVGSDKGLYVSTDGGNNFAQVSNHPDVGMIQRFATGPNAGAGLITRGSVNGDGGGVSRITATNYGRTSTYTATASATANLYFGYPQGLQIFSDNTACAWNTGGDRQGYSTDGGVTFSVRPTTLNTTHVPVWTTAAIMTAKNHPDYGTDQVIQVGADPNKWIITGGGAAMQSFDKGLSWSYFPNGSGIAAVKTYTAGLSRHDANRIYIPAGDIGSAIVTDGGASGQAVRSSAKSNPYLHSTFRILEGADANNLVLAGVSQNDNRTLLLKSNDGGVNWSESSLASSSLPLSRDGITKSVMSLNDNNDFLIVLASETGQPGDILPGTINPGVWRTTNGGASFFQVQDLPTTGLNTGHRYDPTQCFIERDATQANVRYFTSRGEPFYKSTNGGTNWTEATHPFGVATWVWGLVSDPVRSGNLWAAGDDSGVKYSFDGGNNWNSTATYFKSRHVGACDGKIAIWGQRDGEATARLWYSSDNGANWTAQTTLAKNFHGVQGITVDRNGRIWVSWNSCTVVTPGAALSPPSITAQPASQTIGAGGSVSLTVSATGNPAPAFQWQRAPAGSATFSNLSNGGSYAGATGSTLTISGTTTAMSGDRFRAVATNSQGSATSNAATLTVTAAAPAITSTLTRSGTVGTALSYTITASNSPTSYSATNLPAGLSLNTSTGVISGTPTAAGTTNTTISATNAGGTGSATLVFTISAGGGGTAIALVNPGFEADESQTPAGWSTWSNTTANAAADYAEAWEPRTGARHLSHWISTGLYQVYTYQTVSGLANGTYTVRAWTKSTGGQTEANMTVKNYGGPLLSSTIPAGTASYTQRVISGIAVTNNQLEIGFWSNTSANDQWIAVDDVTLTREAGSGVRVGAHEPLAGQALVAYPNPSRGVFSVSGAEGTAQVLDLTGRVLHTARLQAGSRTISAPGLRKGIYILLVCTPEGKRTARILIE